jgi:hypothetical protein
MTKSPDQQADPGARELSVKLPSDFFVPTLAAATVDDDDPADENKNTDAVEYSDEDRDDADE